MVALGEVENWKALMAHGAYEGAGMDIPFRDDPVEGRRHLEIAEDGFLLLPVCVLRVTECAVGIGLGLERSQVHGRYGARCPGSLQHPFVVLLADGVVQLRTGESFSCLRRRLL